MVIARQKPDGTRVDCKGETIPGLDGLDRDDMEGLLDANDDASRYIFAIEEALAILEDVYADRDSITRAKKVLRRAIGPLERR